MTLARELVAPLLVALALWGVPEAVLADNARIDSYSLDSVVSQRAPIGVDPGPPPAFDAADYDAYRRTGNGIIVGAPFVRTRDGKVFRCGRGLEVALYPKTPYTVWMFDKYFETVAQTGYWVDPSRNVNGPTFLQYFTQDSIVRLGSCRDDGTFEIANLPAGKYIALTNINVPQTGSYIDYSQDQTVTLPSGESGMIYRNAVGTSFYYSDGWSLFGQTFIVKAGGGLLDIPDRAWFTVAHIHAGNPANKPARKN